MLNTSWFGVLAWQDIGVQGVQVICYRSTALHTSLNHVEPLHFIQRLPNRLQ